MILFFIARNMDVYDGGAENVNVYALKSIYEDRKNAKKVSICDLDYIYQYITGAVSFYMDFD